MMRERRIVFYAENKASMNHFRTLITELTEVKSDYKICYVTSVKNDPRFYQVIMKKFYTFFIGDGIARTKFFYRIKSKNFDNGYARS